MQAKKEIIKIEKIIQKELEFILKEQKLTGNFNNFSSFQADCLQKIKNYELTFPAGLILSALAPLKTNPRIEKLLNQTVKFLLKEKNQFWSFNYWSRSAKESQKWPDDMDTVACVLAGITLVEPSKINGEVLAKVVNLLTLLEVKEGGPYRTWVVDSKSHASLLDIDLVVNSNIAYFLSLQGVFLDNLNELVETAIKKKQLSSRYYLGSCPVFYFIARFYQGKEIETLKKLIKKTRNKAGYWENPLMSALMISAWLNLGGETREIEKGIQYLSRKMQSKNYRYQSFYFDPAQNKKSYYSITPALTAALSIEALVKYKEVLSREVLAKQSGFKKTIQKSTRETDKEILKIRALIRKKIKERIEQAPPELAKVLDQLIKKTLKNDKSGQILFNACHWQQALKDLDQTEKADVLKGSVSGEVGAGRGFTKNELADLGFANLAGWAAYAVYDDFLDGEGQGKYLGCANLLMRELNLIFSTRLPFESGFKDFTREVMDQIDNANTWEIEKCRLERVKLGKGQSELLFKLPRKWPIYRNYQKLAERSLGHLLPPAAVLFNQGFKKSSLAIKNLIKFYSHYIIARQLNDDAHDIEVDLKKGSLTPVVFMVLKKWQAKNNKENGKKTGNLKPRLEIDIKKELPELQGIFWHEIIVPVAEEVLKQAKLARQALKELKQSGVIKQQDKFEEILRAVEGSAKQAVVERKKTLDFLKYLA